MRRSWAPSTKCACPRSPAPAALILADATAQGAESRLVAYGTDEEQSGFGFGGLGFLLKAVPIDAWVIIAILVVMMVQSWFIMIRKSRNVARVARANDAFRESFAKVGAPGTAGRRRQPGALAGACLAVAPVPRGGQ